MTEERKIRIPEMVRLSPIAMDTIMAMGAEKRTLELRQELVMWKDLVKTIDPNHNYMFSAEYQAFFKSPVPEVEEEEMLDRHKQSSAMAVIDGSFDPKFQQNI
jgi:hypothetical protein